MKKLTLSRALLFIGLSAISFGSLMTTSPLISSCEAMDVGPVAQIDITKFMDYVNTKVTINTELNTRRGKEAQNAIAHLFNSYGNHVSLQNKEAIFKSIDGMVNNKIILGRQAQAVKGYLDYELSNAGVPNISPKQETVPVISPQNDLVAWTFTIAQSANKYFRQPYTDTQFLSKKPGRDTFMCQDGDVINRPNHGLAHGLRQGLYAVDIVEGLNSPIHFETKMGQEMQAWVKRKMSVDPHFLEKIQFASSFQRSGRQSEKDGGAAYEGYMRIDVENFKREAAAYAGQGGMFEMDVDIYADALSPDGPNSTEARYLEKIFTLAHRLDLRRLVYQGTGSFQEMMSDEFFATSDAYNLTSEKKFIDVLWGRAGEYLRGTGDRDRDPAFISKYALRNQKVFCNLSRKPYRMAEALVRAKRESRHNF